MKSLYVISAVGRDKPGLVYSVTRVLAEAGINIVDIDARSVRGHFSMFLVVDIGPSTCSYEDMTQRLRPVHREFDLGLRTEPYEAGRRKTHKRLMVLTVMGGDRPGIVAEVSGICARHSVNIESVKMIARGEYIASEFSVDTSDLEDVSMFRRVMYEFSSHTGLDVSLRDEDIFQKPKRVVVFDCDSTIIRAEVIDELAKVAGVGDHVQQVTAKAMNGEIDPRDIEEVPALQPVAQDCKFLGCRCSEGKESVVKAQELIPPSSC